jgi:naphthalene 1,2-dioxygenase ferredoxin component
MSEHKLGVSVNNLKDSQPIAASVDGKDFAVVMVDSIVYVLDGKCTHEQGALGEGYIDNGELICPMHAGAFDYRTGKANENTSWVTDINTYKTRIDSTDGEIYLEF